MAPFVIHIFAAYTSSTPSATPDAAAGATYKHVLPTIDIPTRHPLNEHTSGQDFTSTAGTGGSSSDVDEQMKGRKPAIAAAGTFFGLFSFSQIYQNVLFDRITPWSERLEEKAWVASSESWIDRKTCDWFGMCGLAHLNKSGWTSKGKKQTPLGGEKTKKIDLSSFKEDARILPEDYNEKEVLEIPQYVLDHAPLIHLYSGENFWPCDMDDHLVHTTPHLNYTPLQSSDDHPNLRSMNELNRWGRFVYLQSDDNVEDRPKWLGGSTNIPAIPRDGDESSDEDEHDAGGGRFDEGGDDKASWWHAGVGDTVDRGGIRPGFSSPERLIPISTPEGDKLVEPEEEIWQPELMKNRRRFEGKKVVGGRSDAPAVLIVVPKGDGVVDAFWFFFYSYNLGNTVFNVRFGNHVGDWEHTTVRFHNGVPKAVFFSEHAAGEAYTWDAVEKLGQRPVGFSATGTHAMYATAGVHPYVLPGGILHDVTDRGPLWDPSMNMYSYTYDYQRDHLATSNLTPEAPIGFFYFAGHWGDKFYPLSDPRQYRFLGQYHYVNGPLGPRFKNLGRQQICQGNGDCILKDTLDSKRAKKMKRYPNIGEGEKITEDDAKKAFGPEYDTAS
ncbi:Vacuolar protein sorting-associated protein 62 [Neodidymelliopsis sp. IMI 364377]|nr:Vacuolar protein sorting-associated protein 62 [Neodidymelliopsis sp. IMI 364377]